MEENRMTEVPFLSNVGLMLTYKCTVACPHCIVKAGPNRKEEMLLESAFKWLDQIKSYRNGIVFGLSLTGGEPFYNLPHLISISDHAHEKGFIVSVVSNAYWASSKEEALRILTLCRSIQMISISADFQHQLMIPFANVKNAIWAAKKLGKLYNIAVATENESSPEYLSLMDDLLEITDAEFINTSIIVPVGRAEKGIDHALLKYSPEPAVAACSMASFPVIFPNGNVIACIGPPITLPEFSPMFLGNLYKEKINDIFDRAENNYVLHAIRAFGPRVLVKMLKDHGYDHLVPEKYIDEAICDVCFQLFSKKEICEVIQTLIENDADFRLKTEYGRLYYFNESEMIKSDVAPSDN
ncbi:MAG: radical SAM protein [Bacteroidetes bacterium]|nr:radical SAM protein [Bacteroidota bacterium]